MNKMENNPGGEKEAPLVVLAYSGGLDTSYCAAYFARELGWRVHSVIVQTGGFEAQELQAIEERALSLGVEKHVVVDRTEEFYSSCLRFLVYGNVLRNGTYPLSVSAERVFQAAAIAEYAAEVGATHVAHGSTGAGNDQIRFDLAFRILVPELPILTPIRDRALSREEEIRLLKNHGVDISWEKAQYSINKGLWGTTIGGVETLTSDTFLPEQAFPTQVTAHLPAEITLTFSRGELVALNGTTAHPVELIRALSDIVAPYGIGRDIHIGDTIIGIKGRVGFEAAAPLVIIKAHHALEKHTLTKAQLSMKEPIAQNYGAMLHEGYFLEPSMRDAEAYLQSTQSRVSGEVKVYVAPYHFHIVGIQSEYDLMSSKYGKYGEQNNAWSGQDARGFATIAANQTMIWHRAAQQENAVEG